MLSYLKNVLASDTLYKKIYILFAVFALFFVFAIKTADPKPLWTYQPGDFGGVAPDESRHFANIQFYAQRGIFESPLISHDEVEPEYLVLGEIERFPSYLYYYVMSLPARIMYSLGASDMFVYMALRLTSVVFGLLALMVLKKLLQELTTSRAVINATLLATVFTGPFIWMSAAINYDIPSLGLFLLTLLFYVRAIKKKDLLWLVYALPVFMILSITKYTYMPFAALGFIASFGLVLWAKRKRAITDLWHDIKDVFQQRKVFAVLFTLLVLLSSILFIERIGVNAIQYHTANPVCTDVQSKEDCAYFPIYVRNTQQKEIADAMRAQGETVYSYNPIISTFDWLKLYAITTVLYYGGVPAAQSRIYTMLIPAVFLGVLFLVLQRKVKINIGRHHVLLIVLAFIYIVATYLFNMRTLLNVGIPYAQQGRYMLFPLIIGYFWLALIGRAYIKTLTGFVRKFVGYSIVVFLGVVIVFANPISSLLLAARANTNQWLTDPFLVVFTYLQSVL